MVSQAGGVQFGVIIDSQRCPELQQIIERFTPEFETLLLHTPMLERAVQGCSRTGAGPWMPAATTPAPQ